MLLGRLLNGLLMSLDDDDDDDDDDGGGVGSMLRKGLMLTWERDEVSE